MADESLITVVLVAQANLDGSRLGALLRSERSSRIAVIAETASVGRAVALARRVQPRIVVMDVQGLMRPASDLVRRIRSVAPRTAIVVVGPVMAADAAVEAFLAGASGYLGGSASAIEVLAAIHATAAGEMVLTPSLAGELLARLRGRVAWLAPDHEGSRLSTRERDVLRLVADGKGNAAIGSELFISQFTVKNHIANILHKLCVDNRVQAAVLAVKESMI